MKSSWLKRACACVATLLLASCGGGDSGGDSAPGGNNVLFVTDIGRGVVAGAPALDPAPGPLQVTVTPVASLQGDNVQYDASRDELYVASGSIPGPLVIAVHARASSTVAGTTPARQFNLPTGFNGVQRMVLHVASDTLYVAVHGTYSSSILVYQNASTRTGSPAPSRSITIGDGVNDFAIDFTHDVAYVITSIIGVKVLPQFHTLSGTLPVSPNYSNILATGVAVDAARDRVYLSDWSNGVFVIDQASTVNRSVVARVAVLNARLVSFDPRNDRLYVSAYRDAYILNRASQLTSSSTVASAVSIPSAVSLGGFSFP